MSPSGWNGGPEWWNGGPKKVERRTEVGGTADQQGGTANQQGGGTADTAQSAVRAAARAMATRLCVVIGQWACVVQVLFFF